MGVTLRSLKILEGVLGVTVRSLKWRSLFAFAFRDWVLRDRTGLLLVLGYRLEANPSLRQARHESPPCIY